MDDKEFFEFSILDFKERDVEELKKFAKAAFNLDTILTTANDLKYTRSIQQKLAEWISNPSEEFVKLVSKDLLPSKNFTPTVKGQFTAITKRAFEQLIGEKINERLKGAMTPDQASNAPVTSAEQSSIPPAEMQVVTTPEETECFYAIRAMLREVVPSKRIVLRDAQSYCAILLDDNNRKPICRLRFNNTQRLRIGVFNEKREEELISLESADDIFNHADRLKATVKAYLSGDDSTKE
jgi:predicted type IV restriction endonuclease